MKRSSLISIVASFSIVLSGYTQVINNSPYSIYGIGDVGSRSGTVNRSMGGLGSVLIESRHFNSANPASYSYTAEPTGDIGIYYNFLSLDNGKKKQYKQDIGLQNFGLGIPFGKRWGLGFGLVSFSKVGYSNVNVKNDPEIGDVSFKYNGEGGVNQFFGGVSYQIIDNDSLSLAIGANASYLFGSILNVSKSIFPGSSGFLNTKFTNTLIVNDYIFDFGTIFKVRLSPDGELVVGATANIPKNIRVTKTNLIESYIPIGEQDGITGVISPKKEFKGTVSITQKMSGGLGFRFKQKFFLGAEYKTQYWSDYEEDFDETFENELLKNSEEISIGLAYNGMEHVSKEKKFWKHMDYRVGVRSSDSYLQLNGEQLREYGMSFGIGIPLFKSRSKSSINLGFEIGERGSTDNGLIKERWANAAIGFSIAPGYGDRWFYKRKYD